MNNNELKSLIREVNEALAIIAKKHGLASLKVAGTVKMEGSLSDITAFHFKTEAVVTEAKFASDLNLLGFPEGTLGREVTIGDKTYKITGVNLKKPKFGVQVIDVATGKAYGFDTNQMLRILASKG